MRLPGSSLLAALAIALFGVQSAQGVSFYAEILTNDHFFLLPDTAARGTLTVDLDPFGFDWTGMTTGADSGLGAGRVTPGSPLEYTHLFDPTPDSAAVLRAWLLITVADDQLFPDGPEVASVELQGSLFKTGQATLNLFLGDITALGLVTIEGDTLDVKVSSSLGDFQVLASALKVEFSAVPEPATLLMVGAGAALLAARRRPVLR